jgi:hypothetical protein
MFERYFLSRNLPHFRDSSKARRHRSALLHSADTGTRIAEARALNAFEQMLLCGAAGSSLHCFAEL